MKGLLKETFDKVSKMSKKECIQRLIEISVKEEMDLFAIDFLEIMERSIIQAFREASGEIDRVFKNWDENPDIDPRRQYSKESL